MSCLPRLATTSTVVGKSAAYTRPRSSKEVPWTVAGSLMLSDGVGDADRWRWRFRPSRSGSSIVSRCSRVISRAWATSGRCQGFGIVSPRSQRAMVFASRSSLAASVSCVKPTARRRRMKASRRSAMSAPRVMWLGQVSIVASMFTQVKPCALAFGGGLVVGGPALEGRRRAPVRGRRAVVWGLAFPSHRCSRRTRSS
jgi:hypothetical protein